MKPSSITYWFDFSNVIMETVQGNIIHMYNVHVLKLKKEIIPKYTV